MILDNWQKEVLETKGNIVLRSARQAGKSTVVSMKAGDFAAKNKNKTVLVIAAVERQAYLLFEKILDYMYRNHKALIKKGKDRPTKSKLQLKNGSTIYCLPTGLTGYGIRGYTVHLLIADEAAFINDEVFEALTPSLSVSKGKIILLSTPHGKKGYFYSCFQNDDFTKFHIRASDCPRHTPEFLEQEKKRMTKLAYHQEYEAEFLDELRQWFPTDLINELMVLEPNILVRKSAYFLGVDFAGYGGDENAFVVVERLSKDVLRMVEIVTTNSEQIKYNMTGDTIDRIINLDKKYNFKKIYVDDGGMGSPIFDVLLQTNNVKRKVEAINNSRRSLDRDDKRKKTLMKEDLYSNLLRLMEQHKIELLKSSELALSLKSVQYEFDDDSGRLKIFGEYTHICEGLIRAAWCIKDKSLNIYIY